MKVINIFSLEKNLNKDFEKHCPLICKKCGDPLKEYSRTLNASGEVIIKFRCFSCWTKQFWSDSSLSNKVYPSPLHPRFLE